MKNLPLAALMTLAILTGCTGAGPTTAPTSSTVPVTTPTPSVGPTSTPESTPTPTLLARGTFENKGATVELDATREGSNVQGTLHMFDADFSFTVDLKCAWTTPGGLIEIGGDVIDSDFELAPEGSRAAIVLKPGSPVEAHPDFEPVPPAATCLEYLETLTDDQAAPDLEPITEGTI